MEGLGVVKELLFFFQALGPWGILGFVWWQGQRDRKEENRRWEERFESVVKMYEKNVELVKGNEKIATSNEQLAKDMQSIVLLNTQAVTKLTTIIETRGVYES